MRFLQVGVGGFGGVWLKTFQQQREHQLVALVDVKPDALAAAGEQVGVPSERRFPDIDAALAAVQVDAAVVVTPPAFHRAPVLRLLERGIPVVCEKPMAESPADCEAMVAAAARSGVEFAVSQNYRWRRAPFTARRLIQQGTIGQIGQMRFDFWLGADFRGTFRETMRQPLIVDMAIHHVDLIRFLTDQDACGVVAQSWNVPWSRFRHDSSAMCLFTMTGGARVLYNGSWSARTEIDDWNGSWLIEGGFGTLRHAKGRLWLHSGPEQVWARAEPRWEEVRLDEMPLQDQAYVLDDFASAVAQRRHASTTAADNLKSVTMVFKALESLDAGGAPIRW